MILRGLFSLILLLGLLVSCVQQGGSTSRTSANNLNSNGGTTTATSSSELPYFQQTTSIFKSTYPLNYNYSDSFYIRGGQLNAYIQKNSSISNQVCIVTYFPTSPTKKILLFTAQKQSSLNFSNGIREYFFNIQPNNIAYNQTNCASTTLISKLQSIFNVNSSSFAFALTDVCPTCTTSLTSNSLRFFQSSATEITAVNIAQLKIQLLLSPTTNTGSGSYVCSSNENCTALGFQCCIDGQCANDGEVKTGIDKTSAEFLLSQIEILANASRFRIYPQYYYVCPTNPTQTIPTSSAYVDPSLASAERLARLKELRDCVTSQEINGITDEMTICTQQLTDLKTIFKFATNTTTVVPKSDLNFTSLNPYMPTSTFTEISYGGVVIGALNSSGVFTFNSGINYSQVVSADNSLANGTDLTLQSSSTFPQGTANTNLKIKYKVDGSCEVISASTGPGTGLAKCKKYYYQGQTTSGVKASARPSDHPTTCPGGYNSNCDQKFYLPSYTSTAYNPLVRLDGSLVTKSVDWEWDISSPTNTFIDFTVVSPVTTTVYSGQEVYIEYFVTDSTLISSLVASKQAAQDSLDQACQCTGNVDCNLIEVYDENDNIIDFKCSYPQVTTSTSLNELVTVNNNVIPVKFYSTNGNHYTSKQITKLGLSKTGAQEGMQAGYINNNGLYPTLTGTSSDRFNEIYGTIRISDSTGPFEPITVDVKKGTVYDIYTISYQSSSLSPCASCDMDPYTSLGKRVFPSFPQGTYSGGGGYFPVEVDTNKTEKNFYIDLLYSPFRADDLLFGRACFVPATMIPWTHVPNTDLSEQRKARMSAQHFLYANGYNRDWYGFDYGSIIASYDGMNWFSVGTSRRTKAKSNRLYLATNIAFGDLANGTVSLKVQEVLKTNPSQVIATTDLESSGAECQKSHFCSTDNDCITQLGYEYTCANINEITTPWPRFDKNGKEIFTDSYSINLISLLDGGANGKIKRCVYRGRGAACAIDPTNANQFFATNSTNASLATTQPNTSKLHFCSTNNYCAPLTNSTFNNRLVRFAESANSVINNISLITTKLGLSSTPTTDPALNIPSLDAFGLGAPLLGRPWNYNGMEYPNARAITTIGATTVLNRLSTTVAQAIHGVCVPGNPANPVSDWTTRNQQGTQKGDRFIGAGQTASIAFTSFDPNYYLSCPATDSTGTFNYNTDIQTFVTTATHDAIAQNLSSDLLTDASGNPFKASLFSVASVNNNADTITAMGYQYHACMRAPGASCFTDSDCSPNRNTSDVVSSLFSWDYSVAEKAFWTEKYVCSNERPKLYPGSNIPYIKWDGYVNNEPYTATMNRCCRSENVPNDLTNGAISIYSQYNSASTEAWNNVYMTKIAGVDIPINSNKRYSRAHTNFNLTKSGTTKYLPLVAAAPNALSSAGAYLSTLNIDNLYTTSPMLKSQAFTLQKTGQDSCCSGNWVRKFHPSYRTGTAADTWDGVYGQKLDTNALKCLSWLPQTSTTATANFTCATTADDPTIPHWASPHCRIKGYSSEIEVNSVLNWLGKIELTGIPQVAFESNLTASAYRCLTNNTQQAPSDIAGVNVVGSNNFVMSFFNPAATTVASYEYYGTNHPQQFASTQYYFSAGDMTNFNTGATATSIKQIFSPDQFRCCTPHTVTASNIDASKCCTGKKYNGVCCLGDYTDVSLYLNKYVSTEANFLDDSFFDPSSGYIKDPNLVQAIAQGTSSATTTAAASLCCSGKAVQGYALAIAYIPGTNGEIAEATTKRFLYNNTEDTAGALKSYYEMVYTWNLKWNNHYYCVPSSFSTPTGSGGGATSQ